MFKKCSLNKIIFTCLVSFASGTYAFEYAAAAALGTAIGGYTGYVRATHIPNTESSSRIEELNTFMQHTSIIEYSAKGIVAGLFIALSYKLIFGRSSTTDESA